jgi:hypothetical protein
MDYGLAVDADDNKEIVAIQLGNTITWDPPTVKKIIDSGADFKPITRWVIKFMARLDMGAKWTELQHLPTLFKYKG